VRVGAHRGTMTGVGLIEVLITLVIIAGGVMALSQLQGVLVTGAASSRQQSDASFIAQSEIEKLRALEWGATFPADGTSATTTVPGVTTTYSVRYSITTSPAGSMEFKTVQVTVSWTDAQGQVRTYTAATRLQRLGASFSARLLS
jgi:Tfp pilus assembly protein PilV